MTDLYSTLAASWATNRQEIEKKLNDRFIRHAIDNRGILTSPRRGAEISTQLLELFIAYFDGSTNEADIAQTAVLFAEQGMAFVTAAALMRSLTEIYAESIVTLQSDESALSKLNRFQFDFLEQLANSRELIQQRVQEKSQLALQQALRKQLEQQRQLHALQAQRNHDLNQTLQLNAQLALITDEDELLNQAVIGICQTLQLANVSIYQVPAIQEQWQLRATSADEIVQSFLLNETARQQLHKALLSEGNFIKTNVTTDKHDRLIITANLSVGNETLGAMLINVDQLQRFDQDALLILIRSFAQNLAALWKSLHLITEMAQRAHEQEILYGRFIDNIWQPETNPLQGQYENGILRIDRETPYTPTESTLTHSLQIGNHPFGELILPDNVTLNPNDAEFVEAIVYEMGNALNSAQLLQTTRGYANQLSVAEEVSRATSTLLDPKHLIRAAVTLIRDGFGFYYSGIFLVDDQQKMAVLRAGTGNAGRQQLDNNHQLLINGGSMVGAAIADGHARVEQDVTQAKDFEPNPILPKTQSECALPLQVRGRIIGALTVQSEEKSAFSETAVSVLQNVTDQIAIAIENANLFSQIQQNLAHTSQLHETGQQISTAQDAYEIYRILVEFIGHANLADFVQIIVEDPADPDYLIIPAFWHRDDIAFIPERRILRRSDDYFTAQQFHQKSPLFITDNPQIELLNKFSHQLQDLYTVNGMVLIPLYQEGEWLGTLSLICTNLALPSEQDLQPFLTLTDQASIILANQQLLNQTESLYRIGRAMTQAITRDDALTIAVREVAQYTGAPQCRMVLYEKLAGVGKIVAEYDVTSISESVQLPMLGDFVFDYLDRERKPLLLEENSVLAPPEAIQRHVIQFGAKASLLLPSASQQDLIGFMAIDSSQGQLPFKPSNIIFAQTIVDHLTTQIENIKLLEEALNRAQELITLNQIQSNIAGMLNQRILAKAVYEQIGKLLDNTIFILSRYETETNSVIPILIINEGQPVEREPRTLLPDEQLYQFLQSGESLIADAHTPLMREDPYLKAFQNSQSALWVPLSQEGQTNGFISVQSPDINAYDDTAIQLLRSIATQTSMAIANAQLFEKIQGTNKELRQLDHLKTQFLANMSHELRTPLNSIIGFSRVILKGIDGPITPEQTEDLTSIHSNGQHLLLLINEILDMGKIEAGKMSLVFDVIDIVESARIASTTIRSLMDEKKVEFIWDVPINIPTIEADPVRIRQILINLLSNAVKYTDVGSIRLSIRHIQEHISITIADTGIGIAKADYKKLFKAFEQVDNSTTRTAGGTGLGLPITKWLINMHQGEIWFDSELNKGTTFHVTLPLTQNSEIPPDGVANQAPSAYIPPQTSLKERGQ
ncbi:MAG: GAF domain-containing protein [Chloroflexi bacterium]|nr:GAF domain-containing protein [Chloroflexota bacterium]